MTARWTAERANAWGQKQPWRVGCNFIPSTAINQLAMWQEATFDASTIQRELGWAAGLGFNLCRVYLHDLLWDQDPDGFTRRIDTFLEAAQSNGIGTMFVLFDDVWFPEPRLGPQPEPHPGRHNSGWLQSPGLPALRAYPEAPELRARLERYVRGVVSRFADDPRVVVWDVYNEPGGFPSPLADPVGEACLPLLADVFDWARASDPSQPLTSGLWSVPNAPMPPEIEALQLENSDVVSFHHYGPADALEAHCAHIESLTDRPLFCTEYLARQLESRFETHLPIFQAHGIGAINWGLVSGKTQTIHPWWTWFDEEPKPEPEVWFHDILRPDGTPFDAEEVAFLRGFLGVPGTEGSGP
ncbi:MAG: cellulase family glycosylhydrolase [Myxococcota bacterium]|nr:cellulase family glycosylhydrolase [Myxococcota bacterium]